MILAVGVRSIKIAFCRSGKVFFIRARFRRLQTDTDVFLPILAQNDFMNARKRKLSCFFQSVQRHPTSSAISQDFSQPSPPPKCPSRSEISGSGLIFPKYWFQFKKVPICMPKPDFARITNKDPVVTCLLAGIFESHDGDPM